MSEEDVLAELSEVGAVEYTLTDDPGLQPDDAAHVPTRMAQLMSLEEVVTYGQTKWAPFHATIDQALPLPKGKKADTREYQAVAATRDKVKQLGRLYVMRFLPVLSHKECAELALLVKERGTLAPPDQVEGMTVPVLEEWERKKRAAERLRTLE